MLKKIILIILTISILSFVNTAGAEDTLKHSLLLKSSQALRSQNYEELLETARKGVENYPDIPDFYFYIAKAYMKGESDWEKALEYYKKVTEFAPSINETMWYIANAQAGMIYYKFLKDYKKSMPYFEAMIKNNPENPIGYMGITNVYILSKRYHQAHESCIKAKRLAEIQGDYKTMQEIETTLKTIEKHLDSDSAYNDDINLEVQQKENAERKITRIWREGLKFKAKEYIEFEKYTMWAEEMEGNKLREVYIFSKSNYPKERIKAEGAEFIFTPGENTLKLKLIHGVMVTSNLPGSNKEIKHRKYSFETFYLDLKGLTVEQAEDNFQFEDYKWGLSLSEIEDKLKAKNIEYSPVPSRPGLTYRDNIFDESATTVLLFSPKSNHFASFKITWNIIVPGNTRGRLLKEKAKSYLIKKYGRPYIADEIKNIYTWLNFSSNDTVVLSCSNSIAELHYYSGEYYKKYKEELAR